MRIVSLVPHATELLFALGLGDQVVAVTHECDFPIEARSRPQVTRDVLPAGLAPGEIDAAVRDITGSIFGIAFQWVVLPEEHDLDHEIDDVRARIISSYGC